MQKFKVCSLALLHASVCMSALTIGGAAQAQAVSDNDEVALGQQDRDGDAIVVTGSRVVRDGYEAPTPVSVIQSEEIARSATPDIADYVNTLPALSGSSTPQTTTINVGQARQGINSFNLRGLGDMRTLTLLDGRRVGGAINTGVVDVSELPQQLVERVDVVTGGASASYGSDALSGVVNFILDTDYTGFKGEASGGVTTYGDNRNWKLDLTYGTPFAGGRGHLLLSGEASAMDGILQNDRDWAREGWSFINNPNYTDDNGQPRVLLADQIGLSTATLGGAIACSTTSACAPLRGIAFGPGGTPYNITFGDLVVDPVMSGGSWQGDAYIRDKKGTSLVPESNRQNIFGRLSYDVADDWNVFTELSWAHLETYSDIFAGTFANNLVIQADNAFIPDSVAAQAADLGITSFNFGTMNGDLPVTGGLADRSYFRLVTGIDGEFEAFGTPWSLSAYYQRARVNFSNTSTNAVRLPHYMAAIDAVYDANGQIVCRSTLTDPGNGCVPYNVFGTGVNNDDAVRYVTGNPTQDGTLTQNVASFNIAGEPFETWAGPVSIAFGGEYRKESGNGEADPITTESPGNWNSTGGLPTIGSYEVTDGYVETVVPLADRLNVNAAIRAVNYSSSSTYATWKLGAEFEPVDGIRFRAVASRDVREPNLYEGYAGVFQNQGSFADPFNNNAIRTARGLRSGNPNLDPEIGKTWSAGVVLQPTFLPGFNAAIDYYHVKISDGISSLNQQQIVNLCFNGNQDACDQITETPGATNEFDVVIAPLNLATEKAEGIDIEAAYRMPLDYIASDLDGMITIRGLATHYMDYTVDPGIPGSVPVQLAGQF